MGIATYLRSETLVLALFFLPPILLVQFRQKDAFKKVILADISVYPPLTPPPPPSSPTILPPPNFILNIICRLIMISAV